MEPAGEGMSSTLTDVGAEVATGKFVGMRGGPLLRFEFEFAPYMLYMGWREGYNEAGVETAGAAAGGATDPRTACCCCC